MLERGPVESGEREDVVPRRLGAGIDVDERVRGRLNVVDPRGPRVQLDCGVVAEPRE
jgi:hypothetical protein